jgi:hypothetical protein
MLPPGLEVPASDVDSDAGPVADVTGAERTQDVESPVPSSVSVSAVASSPAADRQSGFDPLPGTFVAMPLVKLVPLRTQGQLFYTLDGSAPDSSATPYTEPIGLHGTTLVRVAEYREDGAVELRSASYIQLAPELEAVDSNLPLLVVHMLAGDMPGMFATEHVPAVAQLLDRAVEGRVALAGDAKLSARVGVKVRGRSTRYERKHSYTLEVRDEHDQDDETAQLLDLPQQSDWVLYAPYRYDRALIRNAVFYELSRSIGRYAPRTRFVELYFASNGQTLNADSYRGLYVLTESIQRDKARVPVKKLSAEVTSLPALSGGYILRFDEPDHDELHWPVLGMPGPVVLRYPKLDHTNAEQLDYIEHYLSSVGRALQSHDHRDPETSANAYDMLDADSFIDHHILNLFVKNPDALRLSSYMYKDRNAKLMAGPVWDCDRCMGSYDGRDADPETWLPQDPESALFDHGWWSYMFADPGFEERYWARFAELLDEHSGPLRADAVLELVRHLARGLDEAAKRNWASYPELPPREQSLDAEVAALSDWLTRRIDWTRAHLGERVADIARPEGTPSPM